MEHLGIYIQVPFCGSKCSFCNFSSRVARQDVYDGYCQAVCREISSLSDHYSSAGIEIPFQGSAADTLYFGGGTPSLLGARRLGKILASLRRRFAFSAELEATLEMTPGSAGIEFLNQANALGVNRLSIGAQSFEDRELRAVGRLHSAEETRTLVSQARAAGFSNISLDLIAGLPYQTEASWKSTLRAAMDLHPEHLSVYLFEVDEKSRLGGEVLSHGDRYHARFVPDDDFMADAYETARATLAKHGYRQYEISNLALPGFESAHNLKYWRLRPYIGLGAGAHSFDGQHRWANVTEPAVYQNSLAEGKSPVSEHCTLSVAQQIEEFFFLGLRQTTGLEIADVHRRWDPGTLAPWLLKIEALKREGWLEQTRGRVCLASRALLVSNEIFQQFLAA